MSNRKNTWNYIDEYGILVGKSRIEAENNKDYHERLSKGTEYNSTKQGLSNMLHELIGADAVNVTSRSSFTVTYIPLTQNEKLTYSNDGVYNNPIVVDQGINYSIVKGTYYGATSATVARMKDSDGNDILFRDRDEITIGNITWRLWKDSVTGLYTRIFTTIQIPTVYTTNPEDFLKLSLEDQNKYIITGRNTDDVYFRYTAFKDNVVLEIEESGVRLYKDNDNNIISLEVE